MTPRVRYLLCIAAACGLLAAAAGQTVAALSTPLPGKSPCAALQEWGRQHYTGKQPTLDELTRFDRAHRLAIFNAVTADVRASLWQEQFRRFAKRTDLSDAQRAHVADAIALATPALYRQEPSAVHEFEQFWARAASAFTTSVHTRAWHDLGSARPAGEIIARVKSSAGLVDCNCAARADCGGISCISSSCWGIPGCGPGGGQFCTKRCAS